MSHAAVGPIELEYETFGEPSDPAVLLVMGLGAQLTAWDEGLCRLLADRRRFVIRFDNRDCGLSTHLDGVAVNLVAAMTSIVDGRARRPAAPYTLSDLAADAVGLLDHLGIEQAHVVGASMGGMIAQTMAIEHPRRVRTLTSIMSNTGEREYGQPTGEALQFLVTRPPADREGYVEYFLKAARVFSPHRYFDEQHVRDRAEAAFDRCYYPEGMGRQLAAIMASGDRADGLAGLQVPTLVVHGRVDTLVHRSGGERTAELVPGADLVVFGEMGHDLPRPLWPRLVDLLAGHTA
jgi:pimeloyl-ACP methyl ester carboxylesterase